MAAFQASATVVLVVAVTRRLAGVEGGCVSPPPGSVPKMRTPLSYTGMRVTLTGVEPGVVATPVNDQSFVGSHAPALAMRNCTSLR